MEEVTTGLISAYRGFVQGVYYGTKIRLPHALVMVGLFQTGPLSKKARAIALLSYQHARNLAAFVGVYKTALVVLRRLDSTKTARPIGTAARPIHSLIAGGIGGYLVWANYSSVNFQIVMYLFSRVAIALVCLLGLRKISYSFCHNNKVKLGAQKGLWGEALSATTFETAYPYLASVTWALVLWLFEFHGKLLHPSLEASMVTLYTDSNKWGNINDFMPTPAAAAVISYVFFTLYWMEKKPLMDLIDLRKKLL